MRAELTPAGERILGDMEAAYADEIARHLAALTPEEATQVSAALEKVSSSVCDAAA
jgi:hypothetical protein